MLDSFLGGRPWAGRVGSGWLGWSAWRGDHSLNAGEPASLDHFRVGTATALDLSWLTVVGS
jgi:hypothetical protein